MVSRIGYSAVSWSTGSSCSTALNGAGLPRLTGSVSHSLACRNKVPFDSSSGQGHCTPPSRSSFS